MASSTTNLDLILPVGGENVSRQIINANNVKIDEAVGDVPSGTNLQSQVTALNNNLGKLSDLKTSAKSSMVSAVNELQDRSTKIYNINGKQSLTFQVTNPCFIFMSEDDSHYEFVYCSGSTTTVIAGSFGYGSTIAKSGTYNVNVYNGTTWQIRVWVFNWA